MSWLLTPAENHRVYLTSMVLEKTG